MTPVRGERAVLWLTALALLALAAGLMPIWRTVPGEPGIDFSHYWGVSHLRDAQVPGHTNPYRYVQEYDRAARARVAASGDAMLAAANAMRPNFDLTNTPLLYAWATLYGEDYSRALGRHRAIAVGAFLVALLLLARTQAQARLRSWQVRAVPLIVLASAPLALDLRVGNVASLQFCAMAVAIALVGTARSHKAAGLLACLLLPILTLFKPNFALAFLLLWVAAMRALPASLRLAGFGASVAGAAAGVVIAGRVFTAPAIWIDWLTVLFSQQSRLGYDYLLGNFSTAWWLVQTRGGDLRAVALALSAVLLLGMLWLPLRGTAPGARSMHLWPDASRAAFWAAVGILVTLGGAPLVWHHYYVLALVPAVLLLLAPTTLVAVRICGALGLLIGAGGARLLALHVVGGDWAGLRAVDCLGWLPLALGLALLQWEAGRRGAHARDDGQIAVNA